jgi:hypothetical protein
MPGVHNQPDGPVSLEKRRTNHLPQPHVSRSACTAKQGVVTVPRQVPDYPPYHAAWLDANRISNLERFLYEYGALLKYKWYGYI